MPLAKVKNLAKLSRLVHINSGSQINNFLNEKEAFAKQVEATSPDDNLRERQRIA